MLEVLSEYISRISAHELIFNQRDRDSRIRSLDLDPNHRAYRESGVSIVAQLSTDSYSEQESNLAPRTRYPRSNAPDDRTDSTARSLDHLRIERGNEGNTPSRFSFQI
jgi:hypothetical protein